MLVSFLAQKVILYSYDSSKASGTSKEGSPLEPWQPARAIRDKGKRIFDRSIKDFLILLYLLSKRLP